MRPQLTVERLPLDETTPLRLLLIEDSTSDSELVVALLEDDLPLAEVQVAANLQDALRRLEEAPYDLILADLTLPDADGLAVVHAVRAAHPKTALLVLTGRVDGQLALWALAEGAQDYLVKGQHDGPRLATALLHALQRQRAEQEAHRYLQLARGLLDAIEAPTCAINSSLCIVAVNEAWWEFMSANGGSPPACGLGASYLAACEGATPDTANSIGAAEVLAGLTEVLAGRLARFQHEYACHGPNEERWFSVRIASAAIDGAGGAVISHVDVTEMHIVQQALSHQTLHDGLTGLPNRLLLNDRLEQALADCVRSGRQVGVAFLDLDQFKRVNDTLGHPVGDDLLRQVGQRLTGQMRTGDTLGRYSGDEFVVIWRDLASPDDSAILSERLAAAFAAPFELGGSFVTVSASVGVALGSPSQTGDELLMAADAAMYDAKRHGGSRIRVFDNELRRGVERLADTETALRSALSRSELVLHYQPVIDLASGQPVAVEALARWRHPERGLLGPDMFIAVAESSGLIVPLGTWALAQACNDAAAFTEAATGLDVAVNISTRQLAQPDLVAQVRTALTDSGLPAERLLLEVTESAMMEDPEAAAITLEALSGLGVRIAIDDFGTGYSSLLYLRRYPISTLKLDRTFVAGIGKSPDDEAICSSVVGLAKAVGTTSIGEGVETMEQYAALRRYGCQQAQGFLWSAAVPVKMLSAALLRCLAVPVPSPTPPSRARVRGERRVDPETAGRIRALHLEGASLHTIAAALNASKMLTPRGSRWSAQAIAGHIASTREA
ncbi:MAG: hypothetical protein QOJ92_846 [Frankiales bacterium]|nr:hypothetical protein [Frankiales bacterium]